MKERIGLGLHGDKNRILSNIVHPRTFGQRSADLIAKWAGSWTFIVSFLVFLGLWMLVNIYAWLNVWDPYPFILLNLVLSCIAALQAPVILMSQNRQSQKDRAKAEYDYKVNRKSEREIEEVLTRLKRIERKVDFGDTKRTANTIKAKM